MQIAIATNTFGKYHRQNVAAESWLHLKEQYPDNVRLLNFQFKDEEDTFRDHYDGIETLFTLNDSSKTFIPDAKKKLPLIYEILCHASFQKTDYFVFTNSDVILLPRLIEYILKEQPDCMAGPRLDIEDVDSYQKVIDGHVKPIRVEIAGYDFFVFKKSWFILYSPYFSSRFLIGKPLFDVDYAGLMVLLGQKYHIANSYPMMALHIHHGIESVTTDCPEKDWNENEHKDNVLFQVANNVMYHNLQYNLCRRKPWGAFIHPAADEQDRQKEFFDTMNIHKENKIKYVQ